VAEFFIFEHFFFKFNICSFQLFCPLNYFLFKIIFIFIEI